MSHKLYLLCLGPDLTLEYTLNSEKNNKFILELGPQTPLVVQNIYSESTQHAKYMYSEAMPVWKYISRMCHSQFRVYTEEIYFYSQFGFRDRKYILCDIGGQKYIQAKC